MASLTENTGVQMDSSVILFILFFACEMFVLFVFVAVRLVLRPIRAVELSEHEREYIIRAYRERKAS